MTSFSYKTDRSASVLVRVKGHSAEQSGPEVPLTRLWVAMVTGVVEVVDVIEEVRNSARLVENRNENVLLAVCEGGKLEERGVVSSYKESRNNKPMYG